MNGKGVRFDPRRPCHQADMNKADAALRRIGLFSCPPPFRSGAGSERVPQVGANRLRSARPDQERGKAALSAVIAAGPSSFISRPMASRNSRSE